MCPFHLYNVCQLLVGDGTCLKDNGVCVAYLGRVLDKLEGFLGATSALQFLSQPASSVSRSGPHFYAHLALEYTCPYLGWMGVSGSCEICFCHEIRVYVVLVTEACLPLVLTAILVVVGGGL